MVTVLAEEFESSNKEGYGGRMVHPDDIWKEQLIDSNLTVKLEEAEGEEDDGFNFKIEYSDTSEEGISWGMNPFQDCLPIAENLHSVSATLFNWLVMYRLSIYAYVPLFHCFYSEQYFFCSAEGYQ